MKYSDDIIKHIYVSQHPLLKYIPCNDSTVLPGVNLFQPIITYIVFEHISFYNKLFHYIYLFFIPCFEVCACGLTPAPPLKFDPPHEQCRLSEKA